MKRLIFGLMTVLMVSCVPKFNVSLIKTYPSLDYKQEVIVYGVSEEVPASAIEIGTIKIDNMGFSKNCEWEVVVEKAKLEARKAGGNVLKITEHIPLNEKGRYYNKITAKILKEDNAEDLKKFKQNEPVLFDSTWNYAKLYIYRPSGMGAFVGYNLYLGDSFLCRVKNNSKQELKITKTGLNTIWAKTETLEEIPIDIEFGKTYYLRCRISMGIMVGRPKLELIETKQGEIEFYSVKGK